MNPGLGSRLAGLLLSLILLAGCAGYHLRGAQALSQRYPELRLENPDTPLGTALARQLNMAGVRLNGGEQAPRLHVLQAGFQRKVLSLDSRGRVSEFLLVYRVRFQLRAPGRHWPEREIRLERAFNFDDDQILGKFRQEQLMREEMLRDAASRVLEALIYLLTPEGIQPEPDHAAEKPG